MSRSAKINWLLLLAVAAVFALNWTLEPVTDRSNYEFLPGMLYAVPAESFAESPVFDDGVAMRPPPAGTIPRGRPPLHYAATPEDAERAGSELLNPFSPLDPGAVDRGETVYGIYCHLCHGPGGEGDGIVAQRGFPAPPSFLATNARQMADGRLFHVISFGQGNMPGHASQIEREDRWKAVLWVRQLQARAAPLTETASEPATRVDAARMARGGSTNSKEAGR